MSWGVGVSPNWLSPQWLRPHIAMMQLESYLDESGTHDRRFLTVCGYIGEFAQWRRWIKAWEKRLGRDGIKAPDFHMQEFWGRSKSKVFGHLSQDKRCALLYDLIDLINKRTKFCVLLSLSQKDYEAETSQRFRSQTATAYTFLVFASVVRMRKWADSNGYTDPISFVWERGHKNQAQAEELVNALSATSELRDQTRMGPSTFGNRRQVIPLQSADVLATNWHRMETRPKKGDHFVPFLLHPNPHEISRFSRGDIRELSDRLKTYVAERKRLGRG